MCVSILLCILKQCYTEKAVAMQGHYEINPQDSQP